MVEDGEGAFLLVSTVSPRVAREGASAASTLSLVRADTARESMTPRAAASAPTKATAQSGGRTLLG